jgi:hypothetical protein
MSIRSLYNFRFKFRDSAKMMPSILGMKMKCF